MMGGNESKEEGSDLVGGQRGGCGRGGDDGWQ